MKKEKIKVIKLSNNRNVINKKTEIDKETISSFVVRLLINTIVLLMASLIFKNFYIDGFFYALIGSLLISAFNQFLKPYLIILTMPITFFTFGLFYPFINVIILKLTSVFLGDHFIVIGWFIPLIISFFISFMTWFMENLILKDNKK